MRDDFESAIEAIETEADGAIIEQTAQESKIAAEDTEFEEGQKTEAEAKVEAEATEILGKESGDKDDDKPAADDKKPDAKIDETDDGELDTAPRSWTPAAREEWKGLPEAVRKQISKREHEIDIGLNDGAEARKTGERFNDIAGKYAQVIAAEGVTDPVAGFEGLMQIMSVLRMGTPQQKAQKVADFIKGYQVPIAILDDLLAGTTPEAKDDPMSKLIDERMAPVNQLLAQLKQQENQRVTQNNKESANSVDAFKQDKANEFYDDVRMDMADLIDMAAKRQYDMPLAEAYKKACTLNPEVSAVIEKRAADARLLNGKDELEAKKLAGSSIIGKQIGDGAGRADTSMRGTIEEAWDAQTG